MPAKQLRLPAEALVDTRGFSRGSSRILKVLIRQNGLAHVRFAVIVGVKVDRRSTERHKFKRRVSERLKKENLGRDIIVTVMPAAKDVSRTAFMEDLERELSIKNK